ncbi:MAG: hypothetical protein HY289_11470 [Planctomycetes bacterium]|nr:hypothetical protein [Planctomycetota bacterium]
MATVASPPINVPSDLVDAIRSFPSERVVEHCGTRWSVSPFDIYATCPKCRAEVKLRAFSGCAEIEDVFDAVFEWMNQPKTEQLIRDRQRAIGNDA